MTERSRERLQHQGRGNHHLDYGRDPRDRRHRLHGLRGAELSKPLHIIAENASRVTNPAYKLVNAEAR